LLNAFDITPARMNGYLAQLRRWRPASLYGYASSIALFAAHLEAQDEDVPLPSLKVVCTTGEPLTDPQRALIERVFAVPAATEYGCRDGGLIAHEAPGGGVLVNSEFILLELLDGDGLPVAPGALGEVVVTNLASFAQPFIRYRTGVFARAASGTPAGPNAAGRQGGLASVNAATPPAALYPSKNLVGSSCMNCHRQVHGTNSPAGGYLQR
jgi:phenylacetate-CoA ligase